MAFEDDLGYDPSQPGTQNFTIGATEIVSRTLSIWSRRIIQYIIIVGVVSVVSITVSFIVLFGFFGLVGTIGADPISYVIQFFLDPTMGSTLLILFVGFGVLAFVLNAIVSGAAIKFTLDEYGGPGGNIGQSFSHSISRVVTIIIVQLILGLIVAIVLTPATTFLLGALDMIDISDPYNPIIPPQALESMMIGMVILLFGGIFLIYLQVRLMPALAVVIDTDSSAIDSLTRAWDLTSGKFFHVFGSYLLLGILVAVLGIAVSAIVAFIPVSEAYIPIIESIVVSLLFSALNYVYAVVLYRDLTSRTESSTLQDLMI